MRTFLSTRVRMVVVCLCSLSVMLLFSACAGVATTSNTPNSGTTNNNSNTPIAGNTATNTNGNNNNNNNNNGNNNNGPFVAGTIQFEGNVQSANANNITVRMPDGQALLVNIVTGQTKLGDNGAPSVGQPVKVEAMANADGSFLATKLDTFKPEDQNTVTYQGMTTSAVGSDNKINFRVGTKNFSFPIAAQGDGLKDFNGNMQSIGNSANVKVKVVFSGNSGTAVSVGNNSNNG